MVLYNIFDASLFPLHKDVYNVYLAIVNLAKYSIWTTRCEVKYDHIKFDQYSSLNKFFAKLKFRIRVDCYRFRDSPQQFNLSWGLKEILLKHTTDTHITFNF